MYCTQCGKKNIPIPRKKGREREVGHLKKMYCVHCKKKTNMVEVRGFGSGYTVSDFNLEFQLHNFNKENHEKIKIRDAIKNQWCKENNIPLIRIPYTHFNNLCIEDLLLETSNYVVV